MTIFDRRQTKEYLSYKCPQCDTRGIPVTTEFEPEQGLYEELYTCYHCKIKWVSVFAFVEKIIIPNKEKEKQHE